MINKGAMFGLDARIALAIFGALSVISSAALYSTIKQAKTEQWRQYFEEFTKTTEQYYLDNGKQLPIESSGFVNLYVSDFAVNRESLSTWKGPYWSTNYAIGARVRDSMTKTIHSTASTYIFLRQTSTWTSNSNILDEMCVVNDADCYEWITIWASNSVATPTLLQLFTNLDELIDGSDGALEGKVRYNLHGDDYIMYRGLPHKRVS